MLEVSLRRSTVLADACGSRLARSSSARAARVRVGAAIAARVRVGISAEHEALNANTESLWANTQDLYDKTGKTYCYTAFFKTGSTPECDLLIDVRSFHQRLRNANDAFLPMSDATFDGFAAEYPDLNRRYQAAYLASLPKSPSLPPLKPGEKSPGSLGNPGEAPPFMAPPPTDSGIGVWTVLLVAGVAGAAWYFLRGVL